MDKNLVEVAAQVCKVEAGEMQTRAHANLVARAMGKVEVEVGEKIDRRQ